MNPVKFYIGISQPIHANSFARACISVNAVRGRRKPMTCGDILLDSGAFTELARFGAYREAPVEYARQVRRLVIEGVARISAAVSQDYMCEDFMLAKTGLTVDQHQRLTVDRFDALIDEQLPCPLMPVLQGYTPRQYLTHLGMYGDRLALGAWVGVGSVCKRNGRPESVLAVLQAIKDARPDLRLHGFGVKMTALGHAGIRSLLYSADSMAWSYAARRNGRDRNSVHEAEAYRQRVENTLTAPRDWWQPSLMLA